MAQIFSNSRNINISGSPTFNAIIQAGDSIDESLKFLCDHAAPGALHDSGERFDPPNCHPGTRIAVLEEIMSWIDDPKSECPVMWMNGAMGGGKSSIAQALAECYHQRRQLLGSFFFARASPMRNNEKRIIATLAYQMSKEMPQTRPYISALIHRDHLIFESSLKAQIEALIIRPHFHSADSDLDESAPSKAWLIIIDSLDECVNKDAQGVIVKAFVSSIAAHQDELPISLKILIVSRPEININDAFRDLSSSVKRLSLNEQWLPDNDIKQFLVNSFDNIRHSHPIGRSLLANWPRIADVEELVQRSSGQFIYASVVINFLRSPQNHPIESLKVILGLTKDPKSRPYAQLDILYEHIFSKVKDLPLVLRILCLRLIPLINVGCGLIEKILELPKRMLTVALTDLVSVLDYNPYPSGEIIFHHASLCEFLQDQDRSGRLYVNDEEICTDLAGRCTTFNKNTKLDDNCLLLFRFLYGNLRAEARSSLCDALSNMDIMPALEGLIHLQPMNPPEYCSWIFAEHAQNSTTKLPNGLENAVKLCSVYILKQFKTFPFSAFDRTDAVDVWVFAMFDTSASGYSHLTGGILSILMDSDCSDFEEILNSDSTTLCWETLARLSPKILNNVELFGKYAMTGERLLNAALCVFKAIPKMKAIRQGHPQFFLELHRWDMIKTLLGQTPTSKYLYKIFKEAMLRYASKSFLDGDSLQELAHEYVLSTFGSFVKDDCDYSKELASIFSDYMEKTRKEILNIDFIIEEERKTELQLFSTSSEVSMSKIIASLVEFFRQRMRQLIVRFHGGTLTP